MAHEERQHALFSASSAHRWLNCPGSILLEKDFPDTISEAAAEGTLAHELAEMKLKNYFYPAELSKRKLTFAIKKLKEQALWDDEMLEHTDTYVYYIKDLALKLPAQPRMDAERRWDYGKYMPPGYEKEGFGTADCTMVYGDTLYVIDFKYGKSPNGKVDAEENPQMMLYALGAYETYKMLYSIEKIHLAIVQPRLPDGISEWTCSLEKLMEFAAHMSACAAQAVSGDARYSPGEKTCRFCRAKAQCRARSDHNVKQAFKIGELPPLITAQEAGERLLRLEDVVKYQKDLQEWALKECLAGKEVPGWKAVEGRSTREWTDMESAFEKLTKIGLTEEVMLWEKRPLTLAQVEKLIGKKDFADSVGDFIVKNPGKPTLVKASDRREVISNKITAAEAFKEEK